MQPFTTSILMLPFSNGPHCVERQSMGSIDNPTTGIFRHYPHHFTPQQRTTSLSVGIVEHHNYNSNDNCKLHHNYNFTARQQTLQQRHQLVERSHDWTAFRLGLYFTSSGSRDVSSYNYELWERTVQVVGGPGGREAPASPMLGARGVPRHRLPVVQERVLSYRSNISPVNTPGALQRKRYYILSHRDVASMRSCDSGGETGNSYKLILKLLILY
jgi:hypothetical protein